MCGTGLESQPEVPAGNSRPWSAAEDLVLAATVVSVTASGRSVSAMWQASSDALAAGLAAMSAAAAIAAFAQVSLRCLQLWGRHDRMINTGNGTIGQTCALC